MKIVRSLEEIDPLPKPIGLTIGTFDGFHLGHQQIFDRLIQLVRPQEGSIVAITFANHPYEILTEGLIQIPTLTSTEEKLQLFEEYGVDFTVLLDFTAEFAATPYEIFVKRLRAQLPFSYLVLGDGASFGKNREGNQETLKTLAPALGFEVEFLPKLLSGDAPISSKRIRTLIQGGKFDEVSRLLGRPYCVKVTPEKEKDSEKGHELLCAFFNLCRIPSGIYRVALNRGVIAQAKLDDSEGLQKNLPCYLTLYTDEPLDPEQAISVSFLGPEPIPS